MKPNVQWLVSFNKGERMSKLTKTGIEYGDYAWNFYPGCLHNPYLIPERLLAPLSVKKPARILVNFMGDLFGDWVNPFMINQNLPPNSPITGCLSLMDWVKCIIRKCPQHTFIFLTKQPQNLLRWSPFPKNAYVGVSVTSNGGMTIAMTHLASIKASVRFISFEPLQGAIGMNDHMGMKGVVDWVIVGQQTPVKASTTPRIEWVREIVEAADKASVPVFLKDNLKALLDADRTIYPMTHRYIRDAIGSGEWTLRQEYPAML